MISTPTADLNFSRAVKRGGFLALMAAGAILVEQDIGALDVSVEGLTLTETTFGSFVKRRRNGGSLRLLASAKFMCSS